VIDFVTVGHLTLDDIVIADSNRIIPRSMGGGALYSAAGARVWSDRVGIHSCAGKDWPPEYYDALLVAGIDTAGVRRLTDMNCLDLWLLHEGSDLKQQLPRVSSGGISDLEARRGLLPLVYQSARGYHLATSLPSTQRASKEAIRTCNPGALITLDIWVESFFDASLYRDPHFLEGIDAFLPSDKEMEALWGDREVRSIMRELGARGPRCVALKRGRSGSLVYDTQTATFWEVPVYPTESVDSTGAGDSFCGGFLVGLANSGDPVQAALQGTVSASFAVEGYGAVSALGGDPAERDRRLAVVRQGVRRL